MIRVVLAPDKFKGTLTAAEVAGYLADGIRARRPDAELVTLPVADGGDGLLTAFQAAGFARVELDAAGPTGLACPTWYLRRGGDAVVELAAVAGLAKLGSQRAPLTATSRGAGEVLAAALDAGCTRVVLGLGGSASTDGGLGMAQALGARAVDAHGHDAGPGGLGSGTVAKLDLSRLRPRLERATLDVACDVDNPLTGPAGAAAVYGPQKGANPAQVRQLDAALGHWADIVRDATGADHRADPGAGAAGGVGFAAVAILGGRLRSGVELVLDRLGFADVVHGADLLITGEGSLDGQTLRGKAPAGVAAAARARGVPVVAVAGRCELTGLQSRAAGFDAVYTLTDEAGSVQQALADPGPPLRRIAARIADSLGAR